MFSQDNLVMYEKDMAGEQWVYKFHNNYGVILSVYDPISYGEFVKYSKGF